MKNTLPIIALIALFCSCASTTATRVPDIHTSEISLTWAGVYSGTIPSASGSGIKVQITLNRDRTFALRYEYIDRADGVFTHEGTFTWDKTGEIITLDTKDIPPYYKVAGGRLIQLDMRMNRITGNLADHYVLEKEVDSEESD